MLEFTEQQTGNPVRPGWYPVADALHAYWDGDQWSSTVDEDASEAAHERARLTPLADAQRHGLRWRGLTDRGAAWLAHEMSQAA